MTPELCDDLINFSFDSLQDVLKESQECIPWPGSVHNFSPPFLECLKQLVCFHFYSCVLCTNLLYDAAIL